MSKITFGKEIDMVALPNPIQGSSAIAYHSGGGGFIKGALLQKNSLGVLTYVGGVGLAGATGPAGTSPSGNFVPYTGATQSVNLGTTYSLTARFINSTNIGTSEGTIFIGGGSNPGIRGNGIQFSIHIGSNAGASCSGRWNIIMGEDSWVHLTGEYNVVIGRNAGNRNRYSDNVLIGTYAGRNGTGSYGTMIGSNSGINGTGNELCFLGAYSGSSNNGSYTTLLGYYAGGSNTGESTTSVGNYAGQLNSGTGSVHIGREAGKSNTGGYAINIGYGAGQVNTGSNGINIGYNAGKNNIASNSIAIGNNTSLDNKSTKATFIGTGANYRILTPVPDPGTTKTFNYTAISTNGYINIPTHGFGTNGTLISLYFVGQNTRPVINYDPFSIGFYSELYDGAYNFRIIDANTVSFCYIAQSFPYSDGSTPVGFISVGSGIGHTLSKMSTPVFDFDNVTGIGYGALPTKNNQVVLGNSDVTELYTYGTIRASAYGSGAKGGTASRAIATDINGNFIEIPALALNISTAPTTATSTGTTGDIRLRSDYIYVCIATNTWVRSALTTW
jgi:hypothetical protein